MTAHLRAFSLPLVLSLLLAFPLPATPAAAQSDTPESWAAGPGDVTDDFSRDRGQWTTDSPPSPLRTIASGRLSIRVPEPELFRWAMLGQAGSFSEFYLEVDARQEAGAADGMLGVIFRYAGADDFYAFLVTADGWYGLFKYVDGQAGQPVKWSQSAAVLTGAGTENRLGVLADGRDVALFANGVELDRVQDASLVEGQIALVAATNADGELAASFDNFALWKKPAGGSMAGAVGGQKSPQTPTPSPERGAATADAFVTSDPLNVRSGPGTNYPVLRTMKKGDGAQVLGRTSDSKWAKLALTGLSEAWASAQYLDFRIDFAEAPVAKTPLASAALIGRGAAGDLPGEQAKNVAWLVIENHIGRYITLQVNHQNYRVEGKAGDAPGRFRFELQGVGRYRVVAQLPNGGSHSWDLYVEPSPDKCINRQGCVALGQAFLQAYY